MLTHKFNPFTPNGIINPGMFVGRIEEIRLIERCLYQAKNGNPQHFIVQGERGIGKSSLFFYVDLLAKGRMQPLKGEKFSFLTINIDLGQCQSQLDIIRRLARGFRTALSEQEVFKERAKAVWDWLSSWEVLGVQYHKSNPDMDIEEIADDLVRQLASFCNRMNGQSDGIVVLLDEADRPSSDAGLGEILKLFSERLTKSECNNVIFGLAGLPTIITRLRESHESSPRLFHTILLEPLDEKETYEVIDIGMAHANSKNEEKITVTHHAKVLLADISEGYPHFIQQFSYCAFDHDKDNSIDINDVTESAYKAGGALSQLGDKYFNEMYHSKISSDDYRIVLNTMAAHADAWVSRKDLIAESSLSSTTVTNALNALRARNIIIYDESRNRQGYYRLPTRSFATWINAFKSISERAGTPLSSLFDPRE